jgi:hypothetical protein
MRKIQDGVYVTLTTYGVRLQSVHKTIMSILSQSLLPEKIVLWLDEEEFNLSDLPEQLSSLLNEQFEVRFCENLRSFTKLVPSLRAFPDKTLITIDDDFEYPTDLIEKLVATANEFPQTIVCARGRVIKYEDSDFLSYPHWTLLERTGQTFANYCILPLGYAGVLYPPSSLHPDVTKTDLFMSVAPHADDLWFKAMGMLNNSAVVVLPLSDSMSMKTIDGTQDNALYLTHNAGDANTEQMRAITNQYPQLTAIFRSKGYWMLNGDFSSETKQDEMRAIGEKAVSIVNEIRDSAISLENKNIFLSQKLMQLAKMIRPTGSLINQKLAEYALKIKG